MNEPLVLFGQPAAEDAEASRQVVTEVVLDLARSTMTRSAAELIWANREAVLSSPDATKEDIERLVEAGVLLGMITLQDEVERKAEKWLLVGDENAMAKFRYDGVLNRGRAIQGPIEPPPFEPRATPSTVDEAYVHTDERQARRNRERRRRQREARS